MKTANTSVRTIRKSMLIGSMILAMIMVISGGSTNTYAASPDHREMVQAATIIVIDGTTDMHLYVPDYSTSYSESAQVFPYSSQYYLEWSDVAYLAPDVAQAAINEIYARNGYIFKNQSKQAYYESMPGYYPVSDSQEVIRSFFNDYERANVELLSKVR